MNLICEVLDNQLVDRHQRKRLYRLNYSTQS
jgi:hypothetical protein